jgi:hypothetical protein
MVMVMAERILPSRKFDPLSLVRDFPPHSLRILASGGICRHYAEPSCQSAGGLPC